MLLLLHRILTVLDQKQRWRFAGLILFSSLNALLEVASLGLVFALVLAVVSTDTAQAGGILGQLLPHLMFKGESIPVIAGLAVILIYGVKSLLAIGLSRARMHTAFGQIPVFSNRLLYRYLHRPWPFFLQNNASTLLNRMTEQTNLVGIYMFNELAVLLSEILVVLAIFTFLMWLNPLVTGGLALLLGFTGYVLYLCLRHSGTRLGAIRLATQTAAFKTAETAMSGAKEIRLNQSQDYFYRRFSDNTTNAIHALATIMTVREIPRFVMEFMIVAGFLLLLGVLMARATPTETILSIAAVYAAASFRLLPSLNRIAQAVYHLRVGTPVFNALYDDLKLTGENIPAPSPSAALGNWFGSPIGHCFHREAAAITLPAGDWPWVADMMLCLRAARRFPVAYRAASIGEFCMENRKYFKAFANSLESVYEEGLIRMTAARWSLEDTGDTDGFQRLQDGIRRDSMRLLIRRGLQQPSPERLLRRIAQDAMLLKSYARIVKRKLRR